VGAVIPSSSGSDTEFLAAVQTLLTQNSILIPITQKSDLLIGLESLRIVLMSTSLISFLLILFTVGILGQRFFRFSTPSKSQSLFAGLVLMCWVFLAKGYIVNHAHILMTGVAVLALAVISTLNATISPRPESQELK
jgi:peptidoglycan/LPS O-acetylase OafA/YrhL